MTRLQRAFFRRLPRHPLLLRRTTAAARSTFLAAPEASYATLKAMLSDVDRRTLSDPQVRTVILDVTREALRPGIEGPVSDMLIYGRPWGVNLSGIRCPSVLWQGNADTIVPPRLAFALGASLPECNVRRLDGQGHFWVLEHVQDVLEAVSGFLS
jgi:pimeloyl-ACP methyl ester carboxylesterase